MVPRTGLEPASLAALAPEASVSTDFTIGAVRVRPRSAARKCSYSVENGVPDQTRTGTPKRHGVLRTGCLPIPPQGQVNRIRESPQDRARAFAVIMEWCRRPESNQLRMDFQSIALPHELQRQEGGGTKGTRIPNRLIDNQLLYQLSYGTNVQYGVKDGTRTRNRRSHNPVLYQLSYPHH